MALSALLHQILTNVGSKAPDGRPLYAYRCDPLLAQTLRQTVGSLLRPNQVISPEFAAGFCLGAACWIGAQSDNGSTTWTDLWMNGFQAARHRELPPALRDQLVTRGLRWWGRKVIRLQTNRYLSSLIVEGGLAVRLLAEPGSRLSAYVLDVAIDHERFPDESLDELAIRHDGRLARSYRNATVHALIGSLVGVIAECRRELVKLGPTKDPLATLDQALPLWRSKLPLELSDDVATNLIVGLLEAPTAEAAPNFGIVTELVHEGEEFQVRRRLAAPELVTVKELQRLGKLSEPMPRSWNVTLVAFRREVQAAKLAKRLGQDSYRVELLTSAIAGRPALGSVSAAFTRAQIRVEVTIPGGEPLPEGPWVFGDEGPRRNQWLGAGSMSVRERTCLVAVAGGEWSDGSQIERIGTIADTRRDLYRLSGTTEWTCDDSAYEIRLSAPDSSRWSYDLRGKAKTLGNGGSKVWLGLPQLFRQGSPEAAYERVPNECLQWREEITGASWTNYDAKCLGDGRIRHVEGGKTLFSAKLTVFPNEFILEFVPELQQGQIKKGAVRFRHIGAREATVEKVPFAADVHIAGALMVLMVEVPATSTVDLIGLRIGFRQGGSATVKIECPVEDISLMDVMGRRATIGSTLSPIPLCLLGDLTLRARFLNGAAIRLKDENGIDVAWDNLRSTGDGGWELPLGYLRDRVAGALAGKIDAKATVKFTVWKTAEHQPAAHIHIGRHGGLLRPSLVELSDGWQEWEFQRNESAQPWFLDRNELVVQRLLDPDELPPPGTVERVTNAPGSWRINLSQLRQGPWLATVEGARGATSQPSLINGQGPARTSEATPLESIVNIREESARRQAMVGLVATLAESPEHDDWPALERLLKRAAELPVTTFNILRQIASNPLAAAQVALQFPDEARLWERFQELPFLWSVIGLDHWVQAARLRWCLCEELSSEDGRSGTIIREAQRQYFDSFCNRVANFCPGLDILRGVFVHRAPQFGLSPGREWLAADRLLELAFDARMRLFEGHDEHRWPGFAFSLTSNVGCRVEDFFRLRIAGEGWRDAVLLAPIDAAGCAATSTWPEERQLKLLHELRGFDTEWFDQMHSIALEWIVAHCIVPSLVPS